jgi:hypothetical protein
VALVAANDCIARAFITVAFSHRSQSDVISEIAPQSSLLVHGNRAGRDRSIHVFVRFQKGINHKIRLATPHTAEATTAPTHNRRDGITVT